jgi:carboxyl-terminal processing protease
MRPSRPLLASLALVALLTGCPGDDDLECSPEVEKRAVRDLVYDRYLYSDTLPPPIADVDLAQYESAGALLWALTKPARDQDMDRGWSWITTAAASQSYFEEGTTVGFGIQNLVRGTTLYVSQVYPGSAAAGAGIGRGDAILRIGETEGTLQDVGAAIAADLANQTNTLGALFGPSQPGVVRAFELAPAGGGAPVVRVLTKGTFGLDPVPVVGDAGQRWKIIPNGDRNVGYVALRTFVATADAPLEQAFAAFKEAGVTDVLVDLRYNGGGLVRTGELLANLLADGLAGQTMLRWTYNPRHAAENETDLFAPRAASIAATRVAFITTGASASASELVPNVLEPVREVKLVGKQTYGKPVGQGGFRIRGCESVVYLVAFRLENSDGDGAYFAGLPDLDFEDGQLCDAEDDLAHALGDPAEASTGAALAWLSGAGCPAPAVAGVTKLSVAAAPDAYPAAPMPTLAQRHVAGLF